MAKMLDKYCSLVKIFMKLFIHYLFVTVLGLAGFQTSAYAAQATAGSSYSENSCSGLLNHDVRYLNSREKVRLCEEFAGKLVLVVNTASKCAYTDQYEGLEQLYTRYKDMGLVVAGFPSNDFGAQEPGTEKQIQNFCRLTYSVNFPMFAKTGVRENNADQLYRDLASASGRYPAWNFHKYLIGRDGRLVADFPSHVDPFAPQLIQQIESRL